MKTIIMAERRKTTTRRIASVRRRRLRGIPAIAELIGTPSASASALACGLSIRQATAPIIGPITRPTAIAGHMPSRPQRWYSHIATTGPAE